MDKLFPIIRRKRRPLIQENPEMLKAETLKPESAPAVPAPDKSKADDGKNVSITEAQ
jgi:hypothetical protein